MAKNSFVFKSFSFDRYSGFFQLNYSIYLENRNFDFVETLLLPTEDFIDYNEEELQRSLFNLHLAFGISYYKTYLPENIIIKTGVLDKNQSSFWNSVYSNGLGEFFYKNNIDPKLKIDFPYKNDVPLNIEKTNYHKKSLLLLGGGKDSLVSYSILKNKNQDFDILTLRDNHIFQSLDVILNKKRIIIQRNIDRQLIDLNNQGAFNGHIPISVLISFLSVVVSILYGYKEVIFSNEKSASDYNLIYKNKKINHQWAKSEEAEQLISNYVSKYITKNTKIYSLLRKYSEMEIMKIFSAQKEFFDYFSSCNRNFHIQNNKKIKNKLWCLECPKCVFTFIFLSVFLEKNQLINIFKENLFERTDLLDLFKELWGEKNFKPFECVGTKEEVCEAFEIIVKKNDYKNDFIIKEFLNFKNKSVF